MLRLPLLVAGVGVAFLLSRHWPREHTVHVVLGDSAAHVEEVRLRYAETATGTGRATGAGDDWEREVTFHYAEGHAPRVVSHEPRLPDGDYDLEVEIGVQTPDGKRTATGQRKVHLTGDTAQVDVASIVRDTLP